MMASNSTGVKRATHRSDQSVMGESAQEFPAPKLRSSVAVDDAADHRGLHHLMGNHTRRRMHAEGLRVEDERGFVFSSQAELDF